MGKLSDLPPALFICKQTVDELGKNGLDGYVNRQIGGIYYGREYIRCQMMGWYDGQLTEDKTFRSQHGSAE